MLDGRGCLVLLAGEAGSGKTALLRRFRAECGAAESRAVGCVRPAPVGAVRGRRGAGRRRPRPAARRGRETVRGRGGDRRRSEVASRHRGRVRGPALGRRGDARRAEPAGPADRVGAGPARRLLPRRRATPSTSDPPRRAARACGCGRSRSRRVPGCGHPAGEPRGRRVPPRAESPGGGGVPRPAPPPRPASAGAVRAGRGTSPGSLTTPTRPAMPRRCCGTRPRPPRRRRPSGAHREAFLPSGHGLHDLRARCRTGRRPPSRRACAAPRAATGPVEPARAPAPPPGSPVGGQRCHAARPAGRRARAARRVSRRDRSVRCRPCSVPRSTMFQCSGRTDRRR